MATGKPKIQKTCRIRLHAGGGNEIITIYCSNDIIREVKPHVMRFNNNVMIPLRGEGYKVFDKIAKLVLTMPDHFPTSSRMVINKFAGRPY